MLSGTALGEFILQTTMFNDSRKVQENNNEYLPFIHILNILYISFKLSRTSLYRNLTLKIQVSYYMTCAGPKYTGCFKMLLESLFKTNKQNKTPTNHTTTPTNKTNKQKKTRIECYFSIISI